MRDIDFALHAYCKMKHFGFGFTSDGYRVRVNGPERLTAETQEVVTVFRAYFQLIVPNGAHPDKNWCGKAKVM